MLQFRNFRNCSLPLQLTRLTMRYWWFAAKPRQRGTKRREKKITSGHRSYESHFHVILGSYISSNRFGGDVHVYFIDADSWNRTWLCVCDAWKKNCAKAYLERKVLLKIVTNSLSKKIHFKFKVYKKDRSQLRSTRVYYVFRSQQY